MLGLFYWLQAFLIELIWPEVTSRPMINLIILFVIGSLIIWTDRRFGMLPQNLEKIRTDLAVTGQANYQHVWLQFIVPPLILVSGTSLGPEATLVSTTFLLRTLLRDKIRYYWVYYNQIKSVSWVKRLYILLVPNRFLIKTPIVGESKQVKARLFWLYLVNGILWFSLTYKLTGEPSLIIHLGTSHWHLKAWLLLIPILLISYLLGLGWLKVMMRIKDLLKNYIQSRVILVVIGGIAIYLAGLLAPEILFSGQHNFHLFTTDRKSVV